MNDKEKDIEQLIYRELPPDRYCYIHNYIVDLKNQLQQKENIIKDVRELVKTRTKLIPFDENGEGGGLELTDYDIKELLEILDKEVN